jgi:hypothetical protein
VPRLNEAVDGTRADTEAKELRAGDDPVLRLGQGGDRRR